MTLVLRKSIGSFSAGTRVHVVGRDNLSSDVSPMIVEPECVRGSGHYITVDENDLVERRNQEYEVPATNRAERRRFLNKLFNVASGGNP